MRTIVTTSLSALAGLALVAAAPGLAGAAAPACNDPVAGTLHLVHDTTGDPSGLGHEAEETYCGVRP